MSTELNLYGITSEYLEIAEQIIEAGGEINEELETALAINKENLEIKSAKYAYVCKRFDDEVDLIDKEIERLTALKNARKKAVENLKGKVKNAMQLYGITKIESQNIKLSFKASKETIIEDESIVPKKYKIPVPATYKIDKMAIKKDIEAGITVKGAKVNEKQNLQIK